MNSNDQQLFDKLLLEGALEIAGINEKTGEFLYNFTHKLKEVMPELYKEHLKYVNDKMMILWEKGFLDVDFLSDNPTVKLTSKALNKEEIASLPDEDIWSINEIKRVLGL
jgi:hypothetical protein